LLKKERHAKIVSAVFSLAPKKSIVYYAKSYKIHIKIKSHKTTTRSLVWPVGNYGTEVWFYEKFEQQKLLSF